MARKITPSISRSPSAPPSSYFDSLVYDEVNDLWKRWNGSSWVAAGDSRFAPRPATAVLFGTSLEAQGDSGADVANPSNAISPVNGRGWFNWCKAFVGQRIDLLKNSGVSGNTSTQMLARYQTDVLAYNPGWVFMGGPVNDSPSDIPAATTIANLSAMYEAFKGRRVVQLNCAPRLDYDTTQRRLDMSTVNEWLRNVDKIYPHVIVVDVWRILANPVNGQPISGFTGDGTHWLEHPALLVGQEAARVVSPLLPAALKASLGLLDPRCALGGVGFNTSAAGWTVPTTTGTTVTYPADDATGGNQALLVVAGVSDTVERVVRYIEPISNSRFAIGDTVQLSARIRWSGLTPYTTAAFQCHPFVYLRMRKADDSFVTTVYGMFIPSSAYATPSRFPASGDVVVKTPPMTIPTGVDRLYADLGWIGLTDGTIKVSEPMIERIY